MKKTNTLGKILCFILALWMLSAALCACGNTPEPAGTEAAGSTAASADTGKSEEFTYYDVNYNNEVFRIFGSDEKYTMITNIFSEDYTGESIGDAKYKATALVEEKYKV